MVAPNVLFLVHGIGDHPPGWSQTAVAELRSAAQQIPGFSTGDDPLDDQIHFIEICYDDIFSALLQRFKQLADSLEPINSAALPQALSTAKQLLSKDSGFAATHAADVVLYRGFRLVRDAVLLSVMAQISNAVAKLKTDQGGNIVKYGILGHSMGTTVVHDALQLLATTQWIKPQDTLQRLRDLDGALTQPLLQHTNGQAFAPGNFLFDCVFMVANTSRLLHTTDQDPYQSVVRPVNVSITKPGICSRFYNIAHKFDPVAQVMAFDCADAWGADETAARDIAVDHIYQGNVHDLVHYLKHPHVYSCIFGQLANRFTPVQWQNVWQWPSNGRFDKWGGNFKVVNNQKNIEARLAKLLHPDGGLFTVEHWISAYDGVTKL